MPLMSLLIIKVKNILEGCLDEIPSPSPSNHERKLYIDFAIAFFLSSWNSVLSYRTFVFFCGVLAPIMLRF